MVISAYILVGQENNLTRLNANYLLPNNSKHNT